MEQARVFSNLSIRFVSGPGSGWPKLHWSPISDALLFYRRKVSLVRLSHPPMEQRFWKYIFQCVCSRSLGQEPLDKFLFPSVRRRSGWEKKGAFSRVLAELCCKLLHCNKRKLKLAFGFQSQTVNSCRPHFDSGRELGSWEPLPAVSLVCISDLLP